MSSTHKFWNTQPVRQEVSSAEEEGPIKIPKEVSKTPLPLPPNFSWVTLDVTNTNDLTELYTLLSNHYVEDSDSLFRFNYSAEFLMWALTVPGYLSQWHLAIRSSTGTLLAFIAATPQHMKIKKEEVDIVDINFLCVHTSLRTKRLAPVLIREITRRVNLEGIYFAAYTAGIRIPTPYSVAQYYHRPLNIKKLVETDFLSLPDDKISTYSKLYGTVVVPKGIRMRPMTEDDVDIVSDLLNQQLSKYEVAPVFSKEEVRHFFVPRKSIVDSFVFLTENGEVSDFMSYYHLPSRVLQGNQGTLNAAYLFYYACNSIPLKDMVNSVINYAKVNNIDVVNCLTIMDNDLFIKDCKFGPGDGNLNFYLFNWNLNPIESKKVGIVLF
ncbi:hypothetical protein P9112_004712 [Eukaryota sp. TZLM1-RC]